MTSNHFPEYLFQSIHSAPQGYLLFEKSSKAIGQWICIYANEAAERIWGIQPLIGLSYDLLCPDGYRNHAWAKGEEYELLFPASGHEGALSEPSLTEHHLSISVREISNSEVKSFISRHLPLVTKQAEQTMQFGGWAWSIQTEEMEWTPGLYFLLGFQEGEPFPPASKELLLEYVHPEDRATVERLLLQVSSYDSDYVLEFRVVNKLTEVHFLYLKGQNIQQSIEAGKVSIATVFDVSTLREMQGELERKVADLNQSNADLEQFAYIASHDLQEPLRKILSFGERLSVQSSSEVDKEKIFYLDRILNATRRMQEMINNLLEYSRVSSATEAFMSTDLNKIVKNTLSDLELLVHEKKAEVAYDKLPILEANPSQMSQLITNLLNNALKFSRTDTPVQISIRTQVLSSKRVESLKLKRSKRYFSLLFEDNGIGFENSSADKIFTIFKRLRGRSEYEGSGIGLSVCKKVVERHHGLIFAEGQPGVGATFEVILPESQ